MRTPIRRLSFTLKTLHPNPTSAAAATAVCNLSANQTTGKGRTGEDEWNDAWETAWLPNDLTGKSQRAPWESDVSLSFLVADENPQSSPSSPTEQMDLDAQAFVEDMNDNWDQRKGKSVKKDTDRDAGNPGPGSSSSSSSLYCLENIKSDYRLTKQKLHAGLWVKEIERMEEANWGIPFMATTILRNYSIAPLSEPVFYVLEDFFEAYQSVTSTWKIKYLSDPFMFKERFESMRAVLWTNSPHGLVAQQELRIFDSANNDFGYPKNAGSELKNKPDGWETTSKAQDGNVWDMSQREEDILVQEFERRIAFSKFKIASFIKTHIFSRRRPIDGWKCMIEEIGLNARKGKGSVSRLPSVSEESTQPFREEKPSTLTGTYSSASNINV